MNGLFTSNESIFGGYENDDSEMNMIALLSILSNMLFFLLVSFGVAIISLIGANVPTISDESTVVTVDRKQLIMNMSISRDGVALFANNEMLTDEELKNLKRNFPRTKDGYDFAAVNDYLYELKKEYNKSETIVITPDPNIPYEALINAMDASRERIIKVEGRAFRYPLFPSAVISTIVR